jgi:hypothetical protein
VAFWTKKDRLLTKEGKEFTIILRTRGCRWALGKTGGCSMCGYIQDSSGTEVSPKNIINQFDYAIENKLNEIKTNNIRYILKIFNSGSFFDDYEIPESVRLHIYEKISEIDELKEVVVESRPEFVTYENLSFMKNSLKNKYCEIGIGLETVNDYIRKNYINKGLTYNDFLKTLESCKQNDIGVKAYLLFKPPFLTEQGAIDDCIISMKKLIDLKINSISVNPVNIQKGSLVEYLWLQNRYRPPWFYSLFKCLREAVIPKDLDNTRILCDPSGAGTQRGIHNCLRRECNTEMTEMLREAILNQNFKILEKIPECECKIKYILEKNFH